MTMCDNEKRLPRLWCLLDQIEDLARTRCGPGGDEECLKKILTLLLKHHISMAHHNESRPDV